MPCVYKAVVIELKSGWALGSKFELNVHSAIRRRFKSNMCEDLKVFLNFTLFYSKVTEFKKGFMELLSTSLSISRTGTSFTCSLFIDLRGFISAPSLCT